MGQQETKRFAKNPIASIQSNQCLSLKRKDNQSIYHHLDAIFFFLFANKDPGDPISIDPRQHASGRHASKNHRGLDDVLAT